APEVHTWPWPHTPRIPHADWNYPATGANAREAMHEIAQLLEQEDAEGAYAVIKRFVSSQPGVVTQVRNNSHYENLDISRAAETMMMGNQYQGVQPAGSSGQLRATGTGANTATGAGRGQ
ncbi:hypothetical protein BGZ65_011674, partial [Modicella reniformis]